MYIYYIYIILLVYSKKIERKGDNKRSMNECSCSIAYILVCTHISFCCIYPHNFPHQALFAHQSLYIIPSFAYMHACTRTQIINYLPPIV